MKNEINKLSACFPNTGKTNPFQDALINVNNYYDEMLMVLEVTQGLDRVEYQIDVIIACEVLLQMARETILKLPIPENIMDISLQDALLKKVTEMTEDLHPPVVLLG